MAESYSDDDLLGLTFTNSTMFHTIKRLQRERDEARRVAKVLANDDDVCGDETCTHRVCVANRSALAYPEVKS